MKILTKTLSIISIVALCFVCLCSTCGAYWVDTGARDTTWVPSADVFMLRYGDGSSWVSFANAPIASNSGTVTGIVVDGRTYDTTSTKTNLACTSAIYTHEYADRAFIQYPTLRLSSLENPDLDKCYSYLQCRTADNNIISKTMTYEISYKVHWLTLETEYADHNGNPSNSADASSVDNKLVSKSYTGKYSKAQTLRAHRMDGRFCDFRQYDGYATIYSYIPDISTLMQIDDGLNEAISSHKAVGEMFDVSYSVTAIPKDAPIMQIGSIVTPSSSTEYNGYSRYDASKSSLAENFSVKTRNPATLFNFIGDTFNAVMEINIAGIKLGDILGIGVALSVLLMLLKVFAGG